MGPHIGSPIDRTVDVSTSRTDSQCFDELPHGRTRKDSQYTRGQSHVSQLPQSSAEDELDKLRGKSSIALAGNFIPSPHDSTDSTQGSHGRSNVWTWVVGTAA